LFFKGSSKYFETAHFQILGSGKDYIESLFGRYEHFKKIIEKNGIDIYKPYPNYSELQYTDHRRILLRWKKQMKGENMKNEI